jgi:hypothetical protein
MPRVIKIYGHPYSDGSSASARIRYHRILAAMSDIEIVPDIELSDVMYIQKRVNNETLALAERANNIGVPLVYDIDDAPGQCASEQYEKLMMQRADLITTDTTAKAALYNNQKVRIVPDCIDYWDSCPSFEVRHDIKQVVTFGWEHSIIATLPYLLKLKSMFFNIDIKYISNREICSNDNVRYIPWNADTVMNELLSSDVAIVCQGDSKSDSLRSNNRLLVCLAAGIPTIAINSKSYKETMIAADLENQVFNDYEDVASKFRTILHAPVRNRISLIGKEYAWNNFSPAISAIKLRKVFEEAIYA